MTAKVKSRKIKTGGFVFGSSRVFPFAFILILFCAFLLVLIGCESQQTKNARAEKMRKLPAEARKVSLQESLESKFENPEAHFELAQLYHAEGLWAKAEYHYNIALNFDPANAEAQAAMVKLFIDSGDTAKSKNYADIYVNMVRSSEVQSLRLAMAFQKEQLDAYALTCFQQALDLAPSSARVNKQMGYYYLSKNDNDRAKEYLVRSFQLDPRQPEVAGELGRLGVEVRIPRKAAETAAEPGQQAGQPTEKKLKMVMKHGRVQFEPSE